MGKGRLFDSVFGLFKAAVPRLDYYAPYGGKVVVWHRDSQTVDIVPSDPRLPTMAEVPFRHGGAGEVLDVAPGTTVVIGFQNGDPALAYAYGWSGGEHVAKRVLNADEIILGGEDGAQPATLGDVMHAIIAKLEAHVHTGVQTGPGLSGTSTQLAGLPDPRASNVKVK